MYIEIKPGIYPDLSNDDYHASPNSISRSAIVMFDKNKRLYWHNYLNPLKSEKKTTPAMALGTRFHTFILEPEKFAEQYIVEPEYAPLPKVGLLRNLGRPEFERQKAERAKAEIVNMQMEEEFQDRAAFKEIITHEQYAQLCQMRDSLYMNDEIVELIVGAEYEKSYFWHDPDTGLLLKCRPDILHRRMVGDLKTCRSAEVRDYQRVLAEDGYHIQAAMIRDAIRILEGKEMNAFYNICIETSDPYLTGIRIIDEEAIDTGEKQYKRILHEMKEAFETGKFPDYPPDNVTLPHWY